MAPAGLNPGADQHIGAINLTEQARQRRLLAFAVRRAEARLEHAPFSEELRVEQTAFFLGGAFLMAYLLILLHREKGDLKRVLLGVHAGGAAPQRRWSD